MIHPNKRYFNKEEIWKVVNRLLPDRDIANIVRIDKGVSTNIFRIEGKEVYYLRIASSQKENYTPEYLIHKNLTKIGVKVPEIIYHKDFYEPLGGYSLLITSKIEGNEIVNTYKNEDALFEAGIDLAKIHSQNAKLFGPVRRFSFDVKEISGTFPSFKDFLFDKYFFHLNKLLKSKIINKNELQLLARIQEEEDLNCEYGNLLHGDFSGEHIFSLNGKYTGIIDFGDAKIGDSCIDLAYLKINNRNLFEDLFKGYLSYSNFSRQDLMRFKIITLVLGVRIISYCIDDQVYIERDVLQRRIFSFKKELQGSCLSKNF